VHVRKGDTVLVLAGKDRGLRGRVSRVEPKEYRAVVEGLNKVKRHTKPNQKVIQGGIIEKEAPMHVSKLMLVCPHCHRPTRQAHMITDTGAKSRACKRCGAAIDR
jgi:large subunit ribosomal protein L24